jgi:hypothetical protein
MNHEGPGIVSGPSAPRRHPLTLGSLNHRKGTSHAINIVQSAAFG